jgi:hypothetical protein
MIQCKAASSACASVTSAGAIAEIQEDGSTAVGGSAIWKLGIKLLLPISGHEAAGIDTGSRVGVQGGSAASESAMAALVRQTFGTKLLLPISGHEEVGMST